MGPRASMAGYRSARLRVTLGALSLCSSHAATVRMHCFMLAAGVSPHSSLKETSAFCGAETGVGGSAGEGPREPP